MSKDEIAGFSVKWAGNIPSSRLKQELLHVEDPYEFYLIDFEREGKKSFEDIGRMAWIEAQGTGVIVWEQDVTWVEGDDPSDAIQSWLEGSVASP